MFTEDDRRLLREVRDLMVEPTIESDSPYDTASGTKHSLRNLVKYTDASAHALSVETGAAMGDVDNVKQVKDAADRGVARAVAAWNKLPASSKALIDSADPR